MRVDSFSGPAADLKGQQRTAVNVLIALRDNPRISTWDMSEHSWLRMAIDALLRSGAITEDERERYPWHRYIVRPESR